MAIALRYAARSDVGRGRYTNNQDSGYAGPHLLAVADGMGGHAGGDVASSIVIGQLSALDGESHGPDAVRHLQDAIARARALLLRRAMDFPELAGMGTTVTAVLRSGRRLVLAHIGDSRAYLLQDGAIRQVTHDHTFVQRLVDEGRITPDEAKQHPQRSVILRVLGTVEPEPEADVSVLEARDGDRWLLCSDGLSGVVSLATLRDTLSSYPDPDACADRLLDLALRAGAPDNVTCIVADVTEADSPPASTPQVVGSAATAVTAALPADRQDDADPDHDVPADATGGGGDDDDDDDDDGDGNHGSRAGRRTRIVLAALLVVALLAGGGYAAYAWSQQQYYVGEASSEVAIYRGLTQDVGPVSLSQLYETQEIPVEALPAVWQERVGSGIVAENLTDARRIVTDLLQRSELCEAEPTAPPTPFPTATAPSATAAPSPTTAPSPTANPPTTAPDPTATLPEGCEEAR